MTPSTVSWTRTDAFESLEITASPARAWSFVWPGAVVLEPRGDGVTSADGLPLPPGTALVAPAHAARLRVDALAGASLRVFFAHPSGERRGRPRHILAPTRWTMPTNRENVFHAAMRSLDDSPPSGSFAPLWVTRAEARLRENLSEEMSLADLGAFAGAERSHLCRSFRKVFGLTPWRYRLHVRVGHARLLLARGLDCTEIAHALGFCDQSHFTRSFKLLHGATPTDYARSCGFLRSHMVGRAA